MSEEDESNNRGGETDMDLYRDKRYFDSNENPCSIWQMIQREPGWVASRFQFMEAENAQLRQQLTDAMNVMREVERRTWERCVEIAENFERVACVMGGPVHMRQLRIADAIRREFKEGE